MKRRLPPRPPEPPPGKMWFNGKFWDIEEFEEAIKDHFLHSLEPTRRADPSYDWKETTKRKKQI